MFVLGNFNMQLKLILNTVVTADLGFQRLNMFFILKWYRCGFFSFLFYFTFGGRLPEVFLNFTVEEFAHAFYVVDKYNVR